MNELNVKFNLHSRILKHKHKYYVLFFPSQDAKTLSHLIFKYLIPSTQYKLPIS
jgi:hypothetical protein